ncbi:hypothetical protein ElyMa_006387200 [Elysia marginata]|uniref:Uncharacterized protein n=1 Tax=Elysia marginata TaxID=1093978 RepID=A0AAV4HP89_9GAST|nr:hypothetical protein ElyMa_006387200 [Elysia marginata]
MLCTRTSSPKKEGAGKRPSSPQKGRSRQDLELNSKPSKPSSKAPGLHLRIPKRPSTKEKGRKSESDSSSDPASNGTNQETEKRPTRSNSTASNSDRDRCLENSTQGDINQNEKPTEVNTILPESPNVKDDKIPNKSRCGREIQDAYQNQRKHMDASQAIDNEPRSRQPVPASVAAVSPVSPPKGEADKAVLAEPPQETHDLRSELKQTQALPAPPLQGILKESKKSNNYQHDEYVSQQQENEARDKEIQKFYLQRQQSQGSSQYQQQVSSQGTSNQLSSYKPDRVTHPIKPALRANSMRANGDVFHPQENYSTLPRKSALKNSAGGGNDTRYNSLPRRTHNDMPALSQHSNNDNYNSWGSLDRKTESDSGFGALDRSFSSTGSSNFAHYPPQHSVPGPNSYGEKRPLNYAASDGANYAMISSSSSRRGKPQAPYPMTSQPYYPPRPDSVPPLGSKNSLNDSGEVFYSTARPGSVPPHLLHNQRYGHHSETEADAERYGPPPSLHRNHRAGSVPLNYESEPAVYGYASRSNHHYDSDSGRHQRYHHPLNERAPRGLRVHPDDERYRAGPGKRPIPRRHTVGTPHGGGNTALTRGDSASQRLVDLRVCYCHFTVTYKDTHLGHVTRTAEAKRKRIEPRLSVCGPHSTGGPRHATLTTTWSAARWEETRRGRC